jgi:hypothetical protein
VKRFMFLSVGVLCLAIAAFISCSNSSQGNNLTLTSGQAGLIKEMQDQGFLLIEAENNRAYVDPTIWQGIDVKVKESFAAAVAISCANERGSSLYYADIYDKMSGKKLARWSQVYGFKVY